jgi:hypothetical protein
LVRVIGPRTIASVLRTAVYGAVSALFLVTDVDAKAAVDACLIGAIFADYATWLVHSLICLPDYLIHGSYDLVAGVLFGWLLFHVAGVDVRVATEAMPAAFLTFMLVMVIKVAYYGIELVMSSVTEDN